VLRHVVRDEAEPDPSRRYKGLFSMSNRYPAVSADGLHWRLLEEHGRIPSRDTSHFSFDPLENRWLALVKSPSRYGRSVALATSPTGSSFGAFSAPGLVMQADERDWAIGRERRIALVADPKMLKPPIVDVDIYGMPVLVYEGLYLGFPTVFNPLGAIPPPLTNFTRINQVELAVSRDCVTWQRDLEGVGRRVLLGFEEWDGEAYGTGQVLLAGEPVVRPDGELWFYYNGVRFNMGMAAYREHNGGGEELFRLGIEPSHFEAAEALCLAKLRPQGFVSLDAKRQGTLVTKSFLWPPGHVLWLNVAASWCVYSAENCPVSHV
jgi:hypothetical protein